MKHGKSKTRLYKIWANMKQRCCNPNTRYYKYYGGRGIKMCDEWKDDFMSFYTWSMDNGYQDPPAEWSKYEKFIKGLSIDRIDGSKDYCPENCRWIPMQENMYNNKYHEAFQKRIAEKRAKEARRDQEFKERLAKLREKWAKQGRREQ